MLAYAAGLLAGDYQAAEDAVDDAFLDIWKGAGSFSGSGNAEGWIRHIVRNKAIDWLRKQKGEVADGRDMGSDDRVDGEPNPEECAIAANTADLLKQILQMLSTQQREAVFLCYYEDLPLAEIAAISQCPESTVKTRLFHARKRLLKNLPLSVA
jgi:RNA polymerase sigma-70 factor, ECF subfamily